MTDTGKISPHQAPLPQGERGALSQGGEESPDEVHAGISAGKALTTVQVPRVERDEAASYPSGARNDAIASSLSVTIEDKMGNLIKISRMEGVSGTVSKATALQVGEESGYVMLTWTGGGAGKGFVLYRTEKGEENYAPISGTIPYFGRDGKERYRYQFIDKGAKPGAKYDYRLEVVKSDQIDRTAQR